MHSAVQKRTLMDRIEFNVCGCGSHACCLRLCTLRPCRPAHRGDRGVTTASLNAEARVVRTYYYELQWRVVPLLGFFGWISPSVGKNRARSRECVYRDGRREKVSRATRWMGRVELSSMRCSRPLPTCLPCSLGSSSLASRPPRCRCRQSFTLQAEQARVSCYDKRQFLILFR